MKVLGIESSSLVASVALVTDDILTAEYTVNFKKTHSQTLLPMLDEIVKMLGLDLETIDAIATAPAPIRDRLLNPLLGIYLKSLIHPLLLKMPEGSQHLSGSPSGPH